jgi:hypothetical protein
MFAQGQPWTSDLCLLSSWDQKHMPSHLLCLLRWGLSNFLPGLTLNFSLPHLCLLSSSLLHWKYLASAQVIHSCMHSANSY